MTKLALGGAAALVLLVAGSNLYVVSRAGGASGEVGEVEPAQAAIVPGALVKPDGTMSTMLADRVSQAARLWHAGKVEKVLVSGDHGSPGYDEPGTMREALLAEGVAAEDVFTDHAGFDTWATMRRAREIFAVRDAVVVTQGFHMERALFLAGEAGIDASGLTADLRPYGRQGTRSGVREIFSRVKAVADTTLDTPALDGPRIPIGGDGRRSWGPPPPPGAPPAGAPR